jgi:hypothetical protein
MKHVSRSLERALAIFSFNSGDVINDGKSSKFRYSFEKAINSLKALRVNL